MKPHDRYQWIDWFKGRIQRYWVSLLLGIVVTIAVLVIWQESLLEEAKTGVQSSLPTVVLWGGLAGTWMLAFTVYAAQRSERYARQARTINQQLQAEIVERQQIELELRRSEASIRNLSARLELAVASAQMGIWDWDIVGDRLLWDNRMYALYGVNPSDFSEVYQAWTAALHPDDFELATTAIQQAIRGERDYAPEFRIVHPDGSIRFMQAYGIVQRNGQGQAERMIGVNYDITDRKQAESVLKGSEAKYRHLMNHMNTGFVVHAPDTHILQCNATACELLGLSMEQMLGKEAIDPAWHFVRADGTVMPVEEYPVNQVLLTQVPLENYVLGINRGDQASVWVLVTAFPEFDGDAQLKQVVVTFIDVSKLKRAETYLREMAGVLENAVSGISRLDTQGHYLYVNKAYADMTGYQPEEMIGMLWHQTVHPDDLVQVNTAYQQMLQDGKVEVEAKGIRKDGSSFYKQLVMISAHDEQQQFVGHHCFMKDISDRKMAEAALEQELVRSKTLLDTSIDGIVTLDYAGNVVQTSPSFAEMLGYSIAETLTLNVTDWDAQWTREELQRVLVGHIQLPPLFETRHRRKDGSLYDVEISYSRIVLDGKTIHFCICRDISERKCREAERKQAELALQNSQARFAGILEIASDAIITINADQKITLFNRGAERIFGYEAEEVLGQPLAILMPDRFTQAHQHHINHYAQSKGDARPMAQRGTLFGRRKDGTEFPAEASISKLNLNGEITFTTFLRDITARQQAESAIAHLASIVEFSEDAVISKSLAGTITSWNAAAEKLFGYTAAEMVGQPVTALIPETFLAEEVAILERVRSGEIISSYDTQRRRKDGKLVDVSIRVSPIKDTAEEIIGASKIARDISDRKRIEAERKRMETALRKSEAQFQTFMDNSPAPAWITDADGMILYASQIYLRTFQLPTLEVIGKSIFELYPTDIAQQFLTNIQAVAQSQTILETVELAPRPDGTLGDFLVYKFPIPDEFGQILVGGMAIDITLQHRTETALRQSEATKQAIIHAIPDLLMRMHSDGNQVGLISNCPLNIVDNPDAYEQGISIYDVLPSDLAQLRIHHIQQALQTGTTQIYEQVLLVKGNLQYEEVRIVPLLQDEVLVMVRDITDRKQAEENLRYQKEMFQAIVDHIPVMIALFNAQGQIEFINPELERILGWSFQEWQQRNTLVDCYPDPSYRQSVLDHILAATPTWKDFTTLNAQGQSLETSWANVWLSGGQFLGIGQDITDRKQKEIVLQRALEAAEAANLAKSIFLANMSHELRTPLNVILGFTQVMTHDSSLTSSQQEDLQTIWRSGDHLLNLINDVLDLSKIEAGHSSLEESGFDLISLLHTLRTMMTERANAKQLQLTFDIAPDVPQFVIADEQKLRQVLLNLLSNAIKFTRQGSVTLRVTRWASTDKTCFIPNPLQTDAPHPSRSSSSCTLRFEVTDTGVGIAAAEQEAIFDAFTQAEAGRSSMSGTGLGLTISRKLLELMGGSISVESTPLLGSTFTVTVPVCPTSRVGGQVKQPERSIIGLVPGQPHHRILVVDDQRENRKLMVRLLTHLGLEVREATNGQEAIVLWQRWQPHLTWMDIRMPVLDGYEATKQIRAMEQQQASIIIALTAQASQSDRTLALAAGCNDYISKPFREETLFLKLREHLGLEYLYAEDALSSSPSLPSLDTNAGHLTPIDSTVLARIPADWLEAVEEAALRCNDRAIVDLVAQLPPELEPFGMQLLNLANRFEFEQIGHLIHPSSSP